MIEDLVRNTLSTWLGDQISLGGYVFDAYLRVSHNRRLTITQHPVETGASITDHAYEEPVIFDIDIGMTDTTLGKIPNQFFDNNGLNLLYTNKSIKSRSVKAYDVLLGMQKSRQPYELICRYGSFKVVIEDINPIDDYTTKYALRATVRLRQILITASSSKTISSDPYTTDSINRGSQNSVPAETLPFKSVLKSLIDWFKGA